METVEKEEVIPEGTSHLSGKGNVQPGGEMITSSDSSLEAEDYQRPKAHFPTLSGQSRT